MNCNPSAASGKADNNGAVDSHQTNKLNRTTNPYTKASSVSTAIHLPSKRVRRPSWVVADLHTTCSDGYSDWIPSHLVNISVRRNRSAIYLMSCRRSYASWADICSTGWWMAPSITIMEFQAGISGISVGISVPYDILKQQLHL